MSTKEDTVVSKLKILVKIQKAIINYLDDEKNQGSDSFMQKLFDDLKLQKKDIDIKKIIHLLRTIIYNHHRNSTFFTKIFEILIYFKEEIKQTYSNSGELFDFFSNNNKIILFFIENDFIKIDESLKNKISDQSKINFFFPEIEAYYAGHPMKFEGENQTKYKIYEEKRKNGENEDIVCQMIRNDSVEKFIAYVNQNNMKLDIKINESNFETNDFLINKEPTLIEYAAFFGSIQIFNYLKMNNIKLNKSLWLYAIHSNCPQMIHILEENHIEPSDKTYKQCLIEAIKCHHNDIANYFVVNSNIKEFYLYDYLQYANYDRILSDSITFSEYHMKLDYLYDCLYNYTEIVELLIKESYLDVNFKIVFHLNDYLV